MRAVARWLPRAVPRILGEDAKAGLFAMDYLAPEDHPLWKAQLLAGCRRTGFRRRGRARPRRSSMRGAPPIPAFRKRSPTTARSRRSASSPTSARPAAPTPRLRARFEALARTTLSTKRALVHGDVSPKNILHGPLGPVFLDAECAWFGDPAFDLAFCLNHLLLKGARDGADRTRYGAAFSALARRLSRRSRLGERRRPRSARRRAAAGAVPRQGRRQVAGRIPHARERARRRAPRRRAADRRSAASRDRRRRRLVPREMSEPVIRSLVARRIWDFARPPDCRSGSRLERRRDGARNCASRRVARLPRGNRQARWRNTSRRPRRAGCARWDPHGNRPCSRRPRPVRSGRDRRQAHRPRRNAEQGEARGKRADCRVAGGAARGGGEPRPAALAALPRRPAGDHSAAGNPDLRRRRPCRPADRRPGLHGRRSAGQDLRRGA